jgi:hypothetical protein
MASGRRGDKSAGLTDQSYHRNSTFEAAFGERVMGRRLFGRVEVTAPPVRAQGESTSADLGGASCRGLCSRKRWWAAKYLAMRALPLPIGRVRAEIPSIDPLFERWFEVNTTLAR